jgi:hypothetical protein
VAAVARLRYPSPPVRRARKERSPQMTYSSSTTLPEAVYALFAESQRVSLRRAGRARDAQERRAFLDTLRELLGRASVLLQEASSFGGGHASGGEVLRRAADELQQQQRALDQLGAELGPAELHRTGGAVLRGVQRALYGLERALVERDGGSTFLPSYLEAALQVRRYYRELWRFATLIGEVGPRSVHKALRGAGTRIAVLAGCEVFRMLREDDRRTAEELQQRILSWLRAEVDVDAGVALWRDYVAFAEALRSVNLREELVAHDRAVLARASAVLGDRGDDAILEVSQALAPVLGIDDALDETIISQPSAKTLLRELRRTSTRLVEPAAPEPSAQRR